MSGDNDKRSGWILAGAAGVAIAGVLYATRASAATRPAASRPTAGGRCTCSTFRYLFREYGLPLGIEPLYLQALACRESSCDSGDRNGPAWGLMQITEVVRKGHDRMDGKPGKYTREELLDPRVSVYLATRVIANAMRVLDSLGFPANWPDPSWVGLLTAGWNAGYSHRGGIGRVIRHLLDQGVSRRHIDIDLIHERARDAGATRFLWQFPKRLKWWHSVVKLYFYMRQQEAS